MRRLTGLREEVERWRGIEQRARDALELATLGDESLAEELDQETRRLADEVGRLEYRLLLSGPYDAGDAIIAIHAGAGGTDAQDWAEMLLRMYLRWAEAHGYRRREVDMLPMAKRQASNGPRSRSQAVDAYAYLKSERGVHRLVRLSPFDAAHRRHTSFVACGSVARSAGSNVARSRSTGQ
jgi:peptide chain release factor 2